MPTIAIDQLRSHLRMTLDKRGKDLRHRPWIGVAYRGTPGWDGEQRFAESGVSFRTCTARSYLEIREHLVRGAPDDDHLVILADVPEGRFPADLQARLLEPEPLEIEPWRVLMAEFGAVKADPRIQRTPDLALALLQHRPGNGFPIETSGTLELRTLWGCVLTHVLGLPSNDPTSRAILAWSSQPDAGRLLRIAPGIVREQAIQWLLERSPGAALLLRVATAVPTADLIPIGLACGVAYHPEAIAHRDLIRSQGRIERITGNVKVPEREAREWAAEAVVALRDLGEDVQRRLRKRADALLADIEAEPFAYLSVAIPLGYQQRLDAFATTLQQYLTTPTVTTVNLLAAVGALREHWDGVQDAHRQAQADMAARLALWLRSAEEPAPDLATSLQVYVQVLAWVDWARAVVVGGDPQASVQQAYQVLAERVRDRREAGNRRFADLVAAWYAAPAPHAGVLPIEDVVTRLIAPLAHDHKVLVLVLDGMSWPILQEMLADLEKGFWTLRVRAGSGGSFPPPVLSTIPSVTEMARTSLLSGRLTKGDADDERRAFAVQHDLRAASASTNPPALFHRKSVEEEGRHGLRDDIRDAIGNQKQRIVGVVINAIDDHLVKDDMTHRRWDRIATIRVLPSLLEAAKQAKRVIVLCSDHGHVFHLGMTGRPAVAPGHVDGGERWRVGVPGISEVSIAGARIIGSGPVTVPWSERISYSGKKNGYHGGATPQELIAPCVVVAYSDLELPGWEETHRRPPAWWSLDPAAQVVSDPSLQVQPVVVPKPEPIVVPRQESFLVVEPAPPVAPVAVPSATAWVEALLVSPLFQQSCTLLGRGRPTDAHIRRLLTQLALAPGGQASVQSLAEALAIPPIRIGGLVAQVGRMLNRDGYLVLALTTDRQQVRCDVPLAIRQFEIGGGS